MLESLNLLIDRLAEYGGDGAASGPQVSATCTMRMLSLGLDDSLDRNGNHPRATRH